MAAAIRYGKLGVDEFSQEVFQDSELRRLMSLAKVIVDPELDAEYRRYPDKWGTVVSIETDTQTYQQYIPFPKGDPQNPVSFTETTDKFRILAGSLYKPERIDNLLRTVATTRNSAISVQPWPF